MRRDRVRRRRPLSLTPLVDIIFLLLLFFMLTSTFGRHTELDLTLAGVGPSADADAAARPVFVRLSGEGLTVNGRPVAPDRLAAAVEPHRARGVLPLLLSVAEGARAQALVDAVAGLRAVPDSTLAVLR